MCLSIFRGSSYFLTLVSNSRRVSYRRFDLQTELVLHFTGSAKSSYCIKSACKLRARHLLSPYYGYPGSISMLPTISQLLSMCTKPFPANGQLSLSSLQRPAFFSSKPAIYFTLITSSKPFSAISYCSLPRCSQPFSAPPGVGESLFCDTEN